MTAYDFQKRIAGPRRVEPPPTGLTHLSLTADWKRFKDGTLLSSFPPRPRVRLASSAEH